jgi:hypothetical protein
VYTEVQILDMFVEHVAARIHVVWPDKLEGLDGLVVRWSPPSLPRFARSFPPRNCGGTFLDLGFEETRCADCCLALAG